MNKKILVIAHRGASAHLPDNTIESFDQALLEKADMIEMDVRQTADGCLVMYHDRYIPSTRSSLPEAGAARAVSHVSFEKFRLACEERGFKPALLDEVLCRYAGRIALNIELKTGGAEREIVGLVRKYGMEENVIFSSFAPWVVKKLKSIDNSLRVGWIVGQERLLKANQAARILLKNLFMRLDANTIHINHEAITPDILERFHGLNVPVYAWTVDDPERMSYLIGLGVDGIITNEPALLRSIMNSELENPVRGQIPGGNSTASERPVKK